MNHIPVPSTYRCKSRRIARLIVVCPILFALAACTTQPRQHVDPRPIPTAEERVAFGVIGVAITGDATSGVPNAPESMSTVKKAGATLGGGGIGAGMGAIVGLTCGPAAWLCVPVMAAAGGLGGTISGAVASVPFRTPEQVNNADISIRNALYSVNVEHRLLEAVLTQAPATHELDLNRADNSREMNSRESDARAGDTDTRFFIEIPKIALVKINQSLGWNPNVRLEIAVEGRIFERSQPRPAFERRWLYFGDTYNYFEWGGDNGALVVAEIERAISDLGDRIVTDFL